MSKLTYEGDCQYAKLERVSSERIKEMEAENKALRERLEWREDGHDGIYCRDETIRLLDSLMRSAESRGVKKSQATIKAQSKKIDEIYRILHEESFPDPYFGNRLVFADDIHAVLDGGESEDAE